MITNATLRLFQQDIFSNPTPQFVAADPELAQAARTVLTSYYPPTYAEIVHIEQVRGNEVNSTNVRVETRGGIVLMKRVRSPEGRVALARSLDVADWLRGTGVPIAAIVSTKDGQTSIVYADAQWCVLDFVPGGFFSGVGVDELYTVGRAIGTLHRALEQLPDQLRPARTLDDQPQGIERIIRTCGEQSRDWPDLFGAVATDTLHACWGSLLQTLAAVCTNWGMMERTSAQACHIDLHPHNLLMRDGSVAAFLDVDSIITSRVGTAIAFAAFKLVRQHVARQCIEDPDDIAARGRWFIGAVRETMPFGDEMMRTMLGHAQLEILRRIGYILSANMQRRDTRWNHVLPMHLIGLEEARCIFRDVR